MTLQLISQTTKNCQLAIHSSSIDSLRKVCIWETRINLRTTSRSESLVNTWCTLSKSVWVSVMISNQRRHHLFQRPTKSNIDASVSTMDQDWDNRPIRVTGWPIVMKHQQITWTILLIHLEVDRALHPTLCLSEDPCLVKCLECKEVTFLMEHVRELMPA